MRLSIFGVPVPIPPEVARKVKSLDGYGALKAVLSVAEKYTSSSFESNGNGHRTKKTSKEPATRIRRSIPAGNFFHA
jgi:hypothetical protein